MCKNIFDYDFFIFIIMILHNLKKIIFNFI